MVNGIQWSWLMIISIHLTATVQLASTCLEVKEESIIFQPLLIGMINMLLLLERILSCLMRKQDIIDHSEVCQIEKRSSQQLILISTLFSLVQLAGMLQFMTFENLYFPNIALKILIKVVWQILSFLLITTVLLQEVKAIL